MVTCISILRGINVSGHRLIRMEMLRKCFEDMGFHRVTTYVQSGNVVFRAAAGDTRRLEQEISARIAEVFGFEVPVMVLTEEGLGEIIRDNPFVQLPDRDPQFMHVTFLAGPPAEGQLALLREKAQPGEEIFITGRAVYLYCPHGYGRTKLHNSFLESKLKVEATTRNWKTTRELLRMAQEMSARP